MTLLRDIEAAILGAFVSANAPTLPTEQLLDIDPRYNHAEVVRALQDMQRRKLLLRFTYGGVDWVSVAPERRETSAARQQPVSAPRLVSTHPHAIAVSGIAYEAHILGVPRADGTWAGWIEFHSSDGNVLRTSAETSQANFEALEYWASGLEDIYFEGALSRAEAA